MEIIHSLCIDELAVIPDLIIEVEVEGPGDLRIDAIRLDRDSPSLFNRDGLARRLGLALEKVLYHDEEFVALAMERAGWEWTGRGPNDPDGQWRHST